jgi:hypothetical protein
MKMDARSCDPAGDGGDGYVYGAIHGRKQAPMRRCVAVTENGALPTGENRRHPPSLTRDRAMTDRVNTAMKPIETPQAHTRQHRVVAQPRVAQLRDRGDTVLTPRNLSDRPIGCVEFFGYSPNKSTQPTESPPLLDQTR